MVFSVLLVSLSGCGETDEQLKRNKEASRTKAKDRIDLFEKCMLLASQNKRQGDDDVSDLVSGCDNWSYYVSNQLNK